MKTVIVTGASSGIGREFAEMLGRRSDVEEIWVIARRTSRLEELKHTVKARVVPVSVDLTSTEGIEAYRRRLADENPQVVALVNAAGYGKFGEFENLSLSEQTGMIDLNVTALTQVTYLTVPYMTRGSEIYQIGSFSSFLPVPYIGVYAATKAYVLSFTRSLNVELKSRGVRAMAVCPFWVRTEFFERAAEHKDVVVHYGRFYTASQVVSRALKDMARKRDVSVCGGMTRLQAFAAKCLPHKLLMKIWCRQQKKK